MRVDYKNDSNVCASDKPWLWLGFRADHSGAGFETSVVDKHIIANGFIDFSISIVDTNIVITLKQSWL